MGTPITTKRGVFYADIYSDGAAVTSFTAPAATDAIRVISCEWTREGNALARRDHDQPHDGGLKPKATPVRRVCKVTVERRSSTSAGDKSTWQQYPLWAMCPPVVVDDSGSTITLTPTARRLQGLAGELGSVSYYETDGKRHAAINCYAVPVKTSGEAHGIIVDEFEIHGQPVADAACSADAVAQVEDAQITTAADGDWVILVKDDTGRYVTATYSSISDTEAETATGLEAALETARGSETWFGDTVATDTISVTGAAGVPITVTVTPPAGGAASVSTDTAAVILDRAPSFQNDSEEPMLFSGGTITHSVDGEAALNVTKFELGYGYSIAAKKVGGDASGSTTGFAIARVGGQANATLALSCDMQSGADFDVDKVWAAGTAVSFTLVVEDLTITCPRGVIMDPSESESEGDRAWDYKLDLYSDGTGTNMWSQALA